MKVIAVLLFLLSFSGCGIPNDNNHGYGYSYDLSSEDGTRMRNSTNTTFTQEEFAYFVVASYKDVEQCTHIFANGPLVVVTDLGPGPQMREYTYFHDDPLVTVNAQTIPNGPSFPSVLKHGYVHYLLAVSGFPDDMNTSHNSALFSACSGITS